MKNSYFLLVFFLLCSVACTETVSYVPVPMPEITTVDLAKYNMKIIPEAPASAGQKGDKYRQCEDLDLAIERW